MAEKKATVHEIICTYTHAHIMHTLHADMLVFLVHEAL